MEYRDLRDFIDQLERQGDLKRVSHPVSTELEITEISDRTLRAVTGRTTFPQVFISGEHIGGSDDLEKWLQAQKEQQAA